MSSRLEFELRLPDDFEQALWSTKGYFPGAELVVKNKAYRLTFYDPIRLGQDAIAEVENGTFFFEKNLIVVEKVERQNLEAAVRWLVDTGQVNRLVAE
jgi:hypothetical protein